MGKVYYKCLRNYLGESVYELYYRSQNGEGKMIVLVSYYERYLKKFNKVFKDCMMISFKQRVLTEEMLDEFLKR